MRTSEKKLIRVANYQKSKSPQNPRSQTDSDLRSVGLTPRKVTLHVRKKLLFSNTFSHKTKKTPRDKRWSRNRTKIYPFPKAQSLLAKYRLLMFTEVNMGVSRYALKKRHGHGFNQKITESLSSKRRADVKNFLRRDDNSTQLPGKRDSNELSHTAPTVLTFLDVLVPEIKKLVPDLQHVHYLSDSPTYQHRNKTIFSFVADHETLHGCQASWTYIVTGHGKGPCNGVGGTVKRRMADQTVTNSNASIQDAADFFAWSKTPLSV